MALVDVLRVMVKGLLSLRYRVEVRGLEAVRSRGTGSILFLPNHPALVDPILLMVHLHKEFRLRPLANRERTDLPFIGWLARQAGTVLIPDLTAPGRKEMRAVAEAMREVGRTLREGGSVLLYPGGRLSRQAQERVGHNGAVERLLRSVPGLRIVLVRTRGLRGSLFSWAGQGGSPKLMRALPRILAALAADLLFFVPRRRVSVELVEPENFPRGAGRAEMNAYLEAFYNATPNPALDVPYFWWQGATPRELPGADREGGRST